MHGTWVQDIEFVLSECERMHGLIAQRRINDTSAAQRSDWLHWLPHPNGRDQLVCGEAAAKRIQQLAAAAIKRDDPHRSCDLKDVSQALSRSIVRRFLKERSEVTMQQAQRALSEAIKSAKKSRAELTHFIPCQLMYEEKRAQFSVGPVTFLSGPEFDRTLKPHATVYRRRAQEAGRDSLAKESIARARRYYRGFSWIAQVTVPNCAPDVSHKRAVLAVTTAVNIIHILFGAMATRRMAIAGRNTAPDARAALKLRDGNELSLTLQGVATSSVAFPSDWRSVLERSDYAYLLAVAQEVIEPILDTRIVRPLALRFVDAAAWFGQAVRDGDASSSIVKAVTAVERLVVTERRRDMTTYLASRAGSILYTLRRHEPLDEHIAKIKRIYALRSKLVHGAVSPFDAGIGHERWACLALVEDILCAALGVFKKGDGLTRVQTEEALAVGLKQLLTWARKAERARRRSALRHPAVNGRVGEKNSRQRPAN